MSYSENKFSDEMQKIAFEQLTLQPPFSPGLRSHQDRHRSSSCSVDISGMQAACLVPGPGQGLPDNAALRASCQRRERLAPRLKLVLPGTVQAGLHLRNLGSSWPGLASSGCFQGKQTRKTVCPGLNTCTLRSPQEEGSAEVENTLCNL